MAIDTIRHDVKLALRSLRRDRRVAAIAVGSLAVGIAANTTIFSLVQAVEFPRLIYPQASRIVFLESRNQARDLVGLPVSAPDALDIAAVSRTLERPALAADQTSIIGEGSARTRVSGRRVASGFFELLRVSAARGRVLSPSDRQGTIVLSDSLWRRQFGADETVIGRAVRLDGGMVTVVGIMPARFDRDADFWVPLGGSVASFPRDDRQFTMFARLAQGASLEDATRELADVSRRLAADQPATNKDWLTFPTPFTRMHGRDSRGAFFLLQGAVAVVLLIACANIANILLARATRRRREVALWLALGASRGRVLRQLLIESLVLSLGGGIIGVTLAMWGIRLARTIGGFPDVIDPTLNVLVLVFTAALSMLTGVLCGIVPAMRASSVDPEAALRAAGGRGAVSDARGHLRRILMATQVAGAVVLVTCGALLVESLANRERVNVGFDPRQTVRADVALTGERYQDSAGIRSAVDAMLGAANLAPEVAAAGVVTWALPTSAGGQRPLTLPAAGIALDPAVRRGIEAVTPRYFAALGVPLLRGRVFTETDRPGAEPVAIVNDELSRRLWGDRNPVGERLRLGAPGETAPVVTVVGVVGTIRRSAMHDFVVARVYLPFAQYPNTSLSVVVRARSADISSAARALRLAVDSADPSLMVEGVRTMDEDLAQFVAPLRLIASLLGGFGLTGLLLAALGVFGTMSYATSLRDREMAVRSALGASRGQLIRLVLAGGFRVTMAGLVPGVIAAAGAARLLGSLLYGVTPSDPMTLLLAVAGAAVISLAACYQPARVAASVDPMTILRRDE